MQEETVATGEREMNERPVLYLLPGLLCDETVWANQIESLSPSYDVRVPRFGGFDSLTAMAEAVLETAPERFSVAGHSMGARVALEVVRLAPERVERLALLDTGTHPLRAGEAEKRQVLVDLAHRDGMTALSGQWLPPMVHPERASDARLMPGLTAMVERMTPAMFEGQIRALVNRPEAEAGLGAIRCPVLVGVGRQDAWSPVEQHEAMAALIPNAALVVFENSGHMAPIEAPEAVTRALRDWMEGPAAAPGEGSES